MAAAVAPRPLGAPAAEYEPVWQERAVTVESRAFLAQDRGQPVSSNALLKLIVQAMDPQLLAEKDPTDTEDDYGTKLAMGLAYPVLSIRDFSFAPGFVVMYDPENTMPGFSGCMAFTCFNGMTFIKAARMRYVGVAEGSLDASKAAEFQTEDMAQTVVKQGDVTIQNRSKVHFSYGALVGFRPPSILKELAGTTYKVTPACLAVGDTRTAFRPEPYEIHFFDFASKMQDRMRQILDAMGPGGADKKHDQETKDCVAALRGALATASSAGKFERIRKALFDFFSRDCIELFSSDGLRNEVAHMAFTLSHGRDAAALLTSKSCAYTVKGGEFKTGAEVQRLYEAEQKQRTERKDPEFEQLLACFNETRFHGENARDTFETQQLSVRAIAQKDSAPGAPLDIRLL
jgi:hypothetical protein